MPIEVVDLSKRARRVSVEVVVPTWREFILV